MRRSKSPYLQGSKKSQAVLSVILLLALLCVSLALWWFYRNTRVDEAPVEQPTIINKTLKEAPVAVEPLQKVLASFSAEALQSVLDEWNSKLGGSTSASVMIMDIEGREIASKNAKDVYFMASLYKLFVAYEGYRALDVGAYDASEVYLNGSTRLECLDLMIRESDSPCGEKLWAELGREKLTETIKTYGIENTSLVGLKTTAQDMALMTARIARGEGLIESSQTALLDSMKNQIFRDSLNKGFSSDVTVYNKIGFNELLEYHDVAYIKLADGRELIVAVLTSGVGTKNITSLAALLEETF